MFGRSLSNNPWICAHQTCTWLISISPNVTAKSSRNDLDQATCASPADMQGTSLESVLTLCGEWHWLDKFSGQFSTSCRSKTSTVDQVGMRRSLQTEMTIMFPSYPQPPPPPTPNPPQTPASPGGPLCQGHHCCLVENRWIAIWSRGLVYWPKMQPMTIMIQNNKPGCQ